MPTFGLNCQTPRMKELLVVVIFASSAVASRGEDVIATVKQEAQKCAKAVLASDYDSIVLYTHPRIVKEMGGKEAMIGILKTGMSQMRAEGADFVDFTFGKPEEPKRIGTWMTSM